MKVSHKLRLHLLILIVNTVFIGWLFAKTQTIDVAEQYGVLSDINGLKTLSLSLDRSIFELNVDWLKNYDPFVDGQKNRDRIIDTLYTKSQHLDQREQALASLNEISSLAKKRSAIVDEIKRAHSQLIITKYYLPLLIDDLIDYLKQFRNSFREQTALLRLAKLVETYSSSLSDQARLDVNNQFQTIQKLYQHRTARNQDVKDLLASVIKHAQIIVDQASRLDSLSQEILALDYKETVAMLYDVFSEHFAREQHRSQSLFPMLYGILILLILHIAFLFAQLVAANREAMEKADDLEINLQREREVNGLQRQFVSMVSHEFRTPLAIIDGNAQRLLRAANKDDPKRVQAISDKIRLSVSRLIDLMESVLSAARLEEGRIQFDEKEMDLRGLVTEVVGNYRDLHKDRKITMDIDDLPTACLGDPKLLRQVISNLLSNAIKYSEHGSLVEVEAVVGAGMIGVAVRDHGVGIPSDEIEKIAQRFFRASSAVGIAGTGIGLHLVQHILSLHGGRLEVTSILGEGSRFIAHMAAKGLDEIMPEDAGSTDSLLSNDADIQLAKVS